MALNTNQQTSDDILDIKKQSLYARLKTLFSSDTIVRNVGGKKLIVKDVDHSQMATDRNSLRDRFNRIRSTAYNAYTRDFTLSYQAARMDLFRDYDTMDQDPILSSALDIYSDECISGNTIIPTPDGKNLTIKQLTEKYTDKTERFHVFSYDHENKCIKLGAAYNPRSKGIQKTWKVTLDDGKFLIATDEHLFLLRNGEYVQLKNLKSNDSVMPFYTKDFFGRGYRHHYNFSKGWQTEHKMVAEQFYRPLNDNEVVHHKNHLPYVNTPENLQIMTKEEHSLFHSIGENNPFYGKKHTPESNEKRSKTLKEVFKDRDQNGSKNPKYRDDLTIDILKIKAFEFYKSTGNIRIDTFSKYVKCDSSVIRNRMSNQNISWNTFKNEITSTLNHKITSIEYYGEEEVFDISVDTYNNFATDSCFVHNCVTMNELGKIVTVHCEDNNIKEILYNLYEEILHVDFNLWSWTRNLVKYGDFYLKTYVNPEYGVYMVEPISTYNVERIENSDPYNKKYVKFQIRPTDTSQAEVLERYQMSHFRLLSDANFQPYGKSVIEGARRVWKQLCLHGNTEIWTNNGFKLIKDITTKDIIYSFDSNSNSTTETKIRNVLKTGTKKTYKLSTSHRNITLTDDHPILIKDHTGNYSYKNINQIKIHKTLGDEVIIPSINSGLDNIKIQMDLSLYSVKINDIGYSHMKSISSIGIMDRIRNCNLKTSAKNTHTFLKSKKTILYSDFDKLKSEFGLTNDMVTFYMTGSKYPSIIKDKNLQFTVDKEVARLFGFMLGDGWTKGNNVAFARGVHEDSNTRYEEILKKYSFSSTINKPKDNLDKPGIFNVYSKELKVIFDKLDFRSGFKNKIIPDWVWTLNKECRQEFIKGLFDADGSWKWGVVGLSNKILIDQYKNLIQQSGIMCNDVKKALDEYTDDKGVHRHDSYKLYVNFNSTYDTTNERVIRIEEFENESDVYDIEVESPIHNFIANGMVVHNCLLEDSMLIHRVVRAPERRIYSVDIGGIPPAEVDTYMQKLIDKMKKVPYMDERTGEYNLKYNLQNMLDDIYLPVRGSDSGTKIDTLPGMEWTGIDDIDYIKNKMFAALKMPKAFLTFDESTGGKANLSQEDLRFARTIQRIQKIIASELENIGIIHLYAQGYRDESLIDFKVELTNSSTIFEKEKLEIWSDKTALATDMIDNKIMSRDFIYRNVFKMSDDDIEKNTKGLVEDAKQKFRLESIEAEGDDPAKPFKKIGAGHAGGGEKGSSGGGGHGGGGGMGGLGGLGGAGDEGEGEGEEGKPEDEKGEANKQGIPSEEPEGAEEGKPEDIVKEEHSPDRDQSGEHDANDHPFGEDPLGQNELNRKPRKNSEGKRKSVLYHNFENDSPLSLEEVKSQLKPTITHKKNKGEFIMGLREFFDPTPSRIIAENIIDVTPAPSAEEIVKSE